ncbi:MAG TPA: DNA repair protein RadC [Rectinemataceae bacterium]
MECGYVLERDVPPRGAEIRPDYRERLLRGGPGSLADKDLLAILLGSGRAGKPVAFLAREVVDILDKSLPNIDMTGLRGIAGIGAAKACALAAAIELGRRYYGARGRKIAMPKDLYPLLTHFADRRQEHFLCISLNGAHEVLGIRQVSSGLVNKTVVHPREVFADPITDRACAIIVAHNHPSGSVEPSKEDVDITQRLREVGDILGIPLLDHLVFSELRYFSFAEKGLIPQARPE